jgi:hypothetical protein
MDAMGVVKPLLNEVMIEVMIVRRSLLLKSTINYSNLIKGKKNIIAKYGKHYIWYQRKGYNTWTLNKAKLITYHIFMYM